jgi:phosphopantothenoylcysteine synthetase/decarboxylase
MAWSLLLPTKDAMIAFALPITATMGGIAVIVVIISMAITPKFSYKGKHVVVTGGSAGIGTTERTNCTYHIYLLKPNDYKCPGLELAKEYLRRGASVTIVARNQKRLDEAVLELNKLKLSTVQEVKTIAVDVSSGETAVHKAFEGIGAVDVIVNNAG